ncbi:hypothetical protein ACROYT_G015908 [Oculina patagonica]
MRFLQIYGTTVIALFTLVAVLLFFTKPYAHQDGHFLRFGPPPRQTYGNYSRGVLEERLRTLYSGVQTFVLFIGHARSGHSLIGAILDAHSEIIIPHEFNAINKWDYYKNITKASNENLKTHLFFDLHSLSRFQAMFGNRAASCFGGDHYSYNVPGQWQGTYKDKIKVIGDKKGESTSHFLRNPRNLKLLDEIQRTLKTKLKFIHVIRNPFDNIATKLLRNLDSRDMARDESFKADNSTLLEKIITGYFDHVKSAQTLHQYGKYEVLNVYCHEVVSKPQENLQKLCNFLEVTCDEDYIDASSKLLFSKPSFTRNSVVWTSEQKRRVINEMKKYPFMRSFTFDSD